MGDRHQAERAAALTAAIRAHHERLDAEERFDQAMWQARRAGVSVRELAAAVGLSKSQVSRRYKGPQARGRFGSKSHALAVSAFRPLYTVTLF